MPDQKQDKRYATTLARGLSILRAFRPSDNGLGNLELSERTGIPRSTISRLTYTLVAERYLTHGRHHEKYHLGPAAFALGNIASAAFRFVEAAEPIMQTLADQTENLVGVAIHDQNDMLMVKTWRPRNSAAIWLDVGYRLPVLGSSTGTAYLGALSEDEMEKVTAALDEAAAEKYRAAAQDAHGQILSNGYVMLPSGQRYSKAINAAATPFRTTEFAEPVSFLCSGQSANVNEDTIKAMIGPALAQAVRDLQVLSGSNFPAISGA